MEREEINLPTGIPMRLNLKEIASLIDTGACAHEIRQIVRAVRLIMAIRRKLKAPILSAFLNFALPPGSEAHSRLSSYLPKCRVVTVVRMRVHQFGNLCGLHSQTLHCSTLVIEDEHDMEVDTATSSLQASAKHPSPELEIYCYLLVLIFLIDQKKYDEAKAFSSASIARLKNVNRRTVDVLAARLYFYYSLSYELTTADLAEVRGNLLALHRIATLRHDELGQETLLNLLLRNYHHYNLYDQEEKLRSKAPRFEEHSNLQATLCEIPERTIFTQKGMEKALRPCFELTNAVHIGDLELFRSVAEKFSSAFSSVRTHNLIVRLWHNVIRNGLRNISISYSRISLPDVAKKPRLYSANPVADAEGIIAKAIRDGAIDAILDHANGWMLSKETGDIYFTNEPQIAFNTRIAFCLKCIMRQYAHCDFLQTLKRTKKVLRKGRRDNKKMQRRMTVSSD
ncbi:hypothetical protein SLEP1_g30942 [Rubroshorea leprosula]|uniref:PCI domain-containing protein n=1 Tax=Rubroshorea leprosula TaxID=152421 RepID=A0AAV5KAM7_9ROSI|nr:hypothetical protein SLEP1_g30942 [Rubroshorea leprosula]